MVSDDDESRAGAVPLVSVPPLDTDKYREYVDDLDLSEEQKVELLRTLWWIMAAFVDLGFGVDSVQRFIPALEHCTNDDEADGAVKNENAQEAEKEPE